MDDECKLCGAPVACVEHPSHELRNVAQSMTGVINYLKATRLIVQVYSIECNASGVQRIYPLPFGCFVRIDLGLGIIARAERLYLHKHTREPCLRCVTDTSLANLGMLLFSGNGWEAATPVPELTL